MGASKSDKRQWGGRLWLVALVAVVLALALLLLLWPRPLAWVTDAPQYAPTSRPGLYEIPTLPPPPTPEGRLGEGIVWG